MVRQKLHPIHVNMMSQAMQFHARVIVDVGVFLLGNSEHGVVVEPFDVADGFTELKLATQFRIAPVERCDVAFAAAHYDVSDL